MFLCPLPKVVARGKYDVMMSCGDIVVDPTAAPILVRTFGHCYPPLQSIRLTSGVSVRDRVSVCKCMASFPKGPAQGALTSDYYRPSAHGRL
jgi:hypothetical protein